MPIYEYQCKKCKHVFEELVRSSDAGRVACPRCDSKEAERQPSVFAARAAEPQAPSGCGRCAYGEGPCAGGLG